MAWLLSITRPAERDLAELSPSERASVMDVLERLREDPTSVDFRKLAGRADEWRVRVGHWRVIVRLSNAEGIIRVLRVLPRRDAYR